MPHLNCPIFWLPLESDQGDGQVSSSSLISSQRTLTYSNSTIPNWLIIDYCQSNWITSCINFLFIFVSIQFYLFFYRSKKSKSSSSSSPSSSSSSPRRSSENLHKQSPINHLKHSYSHYHHQYNHNHNQSNSHNIRSISQTILPIQSGLINDQIDCSIDNQKCHLISLWNQMIPKILLDIMILIMFFIISLSIIELYQYPWINLYQQLNGRLITLISMVFTLLINYFIVLPQLGLLLLKPGYGNSLYRVTFLIILISYWTVTVINLIYQLGLLLTMGLSLTNHVRLQLTLATICISTCFLCAKLSAILMTKEQFDGDLKRPSDCKYLHPYSSILSKATFSWFCQILRLGYSRPIQLSDLGSLPKEQTTESQFAKFNTFFEQERCKSINQGESISLWRCYWKTFKFSLAIGAILRISADIFALFGPISIQYILNYVDSVKNSTLNQSQSAQQSNFTSFPPNQQQFELQVIETTNYLKNGFLITFLVLCSTFLQSNFSNSFNHLAVLQSLQLKSALQSLIYKKTLRMAPSMGLDIGGISNHMSSDTHDMMMLFSMGHYVWAIPLKIIILMTLLYFQLGISSIIGAAAIYILAPIQYYLGKRLSAIRKDTMNISDQRLKKTNELLTGIKLLKLLNWEILFCRKVENIRNEELNYQKRDAIHVACITILTQASSVILTLVTFVLYPYIEGEPLQSTKVFTGLALFNQLTVPLYIIPVVVPIIISSLTSSRRLSKFLSQPEIDCNVPWRQDDCDCIIKDNDEDEDEDDQNEDKDDESEDGNANKKSTYPNGNVLIVDDDGDVGESEQQLTKKTATIKGSVKGDCDGETAVRIRNGLFAWSNNKEIDNLRDINVAIPKSKLTIVTGPVGGGKTSLLSALMNEMIKLDGTVTWCSGNSRIGFLPQTPWLYNVSLRDNITFGMPFEPELYTKVKEITSLQGDIELLPNRDDTEIGERGINLSGGQRQRVALARAIYCDPSTLILDDPLSALDPKVSQTIFTSAIVDYLLTRGKTVIMTSHDLDHLKVASKVIVVDRGQIDFDGDFSGLVSSNCEFYIQLRNNELAQEKNRAFVSSGSSTAKERQKLSRLVTKRALVRTVSTIEGHSKRRSGIYMRQVSHDPSCPLPCDDYADITGPCCPSTSTSGSSKDDFCLYGNSSSNMASSGSTGAYGRKPGKSGHLLRLISSESTQSRASSNLSGNFIGGNSDTNTTTGGGIFRPGLKRLVSKISDRTITEEDDASRMINSTRKLSTDAADEGDLLLMANGRLTKSDEGRKAARLMGRSEGIISTSPSEGIIGDEEKETGSVSIKVYWLYIKSCSTYLAITILLFLVFSQVIKVTTDFWLADWTEAGVGIAKQNLTIDTATITNENFTTLQELNFNPMGDNLIGEKSTSHTLVYYIGGYCILSGLTISISLIANLMLQFASLRAVRVLHSKMINALVKSPIRFFDTTPIGRILNRFSTDISTIDKEITSTLPRLLRFMLLCFSAIIVDIIVTPSFIIAAIAIIVIYYLLQKFFRSTSIELQRIQSMTNSPIFSHFSQTLTGLSTIRAFRYYIGHCNGYIFNCSNLRRY
ncbi:ATP-binding cassette sub-family C member 8-like isoform X2 [Panonychus citri]|uniref:ATP-binding cassette sub-family C member 8-like isoform X2 n=1 Tax=Panonychus citri TaxID=50023 RepID=UPI00230830A4|nr:ATP-binding cassette sub-family C member 8-like isoform X2 [Panonychus citri]